MKELNFTLSCVDAELPAIQLDNGTWLFASYLTVEFADVSDATHAARWIADNVPPKWTLEFKHPTKKGRPGFYLLLPGFLFVLAQGNSEIGLKFRDEVYEKILPSIIEKGGYISDTATTEQLERLNEQIFSMAQAIDTANQGKRTAELKLLEYQTRKQYEWDIELESKLGNPVVFEKYKLDDKIKLENSIREAQKHIEDLRLIVSKGNACKLKRELLRAFPDRTKIEQLLPAQ